MTSYDHEHVLLRRDSNDSLEEILKIQQEQNEYYYKKYNMKENTTDDDSKRQQGKSLLLEDTRCGGAVSPSESIELPIISDDNERRDSGFHCSDLLLLIPFSSSERTTTATITPPSNRKYYRRSFLILLFYFLFMSSIVIFVNNQLFTALSTTTVSVATKTKTTSYDLNDNQSEKGDPKKFDKNIKNIKPKKGITMNKQKIMANDNNMIPIPYYFHVFSKKGSNNKSIKNSIEFVPSSNSLSKIDCNKLVILDLSDLSKCYEWNNVFEGTTKTTVDNSIKEYKNNNMQVIRVNSLCGIAHTLGKNHITKARLLIIVDNPIDRVIKTHKPKHGQRQLLLSHRLFRRSRNTQQNFSSEKPKKPDGYDKNNDNLLTRSILCKNNKDYKITDDDYNAVQRIFNEYAYYVSGDSIIKELQGQRRLQFEGIRKDVNLKWQPQQRKKQTNRRYFTDNNECFFHNQKYYNSRKIGIDNSISKMNGNGDGIVSNIIIKNNRFDYKLYSDVNEMIKV